MENKTITDGQVAETLGTSLQKLYTGNWVVIVGPPVFSSFFGGQNIKLLSVDYLKKHLTIWNSVC
jgi:hypothetical protein